MRRTAVPLLVTAALLGCEDRNNAANGSPPPGDADADTRPIADGQPMPDAARDQGPPNWDGMVLPDAAIPDGDVTDGGAPDRGPLVDFGVFDDGAVPLDPQCVAPEPAPSNAGVDLAPRCRERGAALRIRDLRDRRCNDFRQLPTSRPGVDVTFEQAIVTGVYGNDFAVQDPEGGPWSGMWVYFGGREPPEGIRPGAIVRLEGEVFRFFELVEFIPDGRDGVEVIGEAPAPAPLYVPDPVRLADGGDLVEALQSVLVEIRDVKVTNTAPDCPRDFGMFVVSGNLRIEDEAPFDYAPARADAFRRIVGVEHHSFDHAKLLPRSDADLDVVACGGIPDKCEGTPCPVEPDAPETGALVITELQTNPVGEDVPREWVELYNPGDAPVDLTGWTLQDCAGNTAHLGGEVAPHGFHLRAGDPDRDRNGGVRDVDGAMGEFFLPNGYGSVLVFDGEGMLVDQVRYEPSDPWPRRDTGETLELRDPALDNRLGDNWAKGRGNYGEGGEGSPGRLPRR